MKRFIAAVFVLSACSHPNPRRIASARDLASADNRPSITAVTDLGLASIPDHGLMATTKSDGILFPGETAVVRGRQFGRLPTLLVAARPTLVLARLEDGGIVFRVPLGLPSGPQPLTVTTTKGSGQFRVHIGRTALASLAGKLFLADVTTGQTRLASVAYSLGVTLHHRGAVAHVLVRQAKGSALMSMDLTDGRTVQMTNAQKAGTDTMLRESTAADLAVSVSAKMVTLWDTEDPMHPSAWIRKPLPGLALTRHVRDAALAPDGKTLAVLLSNPPSLLLADVTEPRTIRWAKPIAVPTNGGIAKRVTILHEDISTGGSTQRLWVLTGDNRQSFSTGFHPAQLIEIPLTPARSGESLPVTERPAVFSIPGRFVPLDFAATFKPKEVVSGTALRQDPARMLLYVATQSADLLAIRPPLSSPAAKQRLFEMITKGQGSIAAVLAADGKGHVRSKRALGRGTTAVAISVTTNGDKVLAVVCKPKIDQAHPSPDKMTVQCGLATMPTGAGPITFHPLESRSADILDQGSEHAHIVVQP